MLCTIALRDLSVPASSNVYNSVLKAEYVAYLLHRLTRAVLQALDWA